MAGKGPHRCFVEMGNGARAFAFCIFAIGFFFDARSGRRGSSLLLRCDEQCARREWRDGGGFFVALGAGAWRCLGRVFPARGTFFPETKEWGEPIIDKCGKAGQQSRAIFTEVRELQQQTPEPSSHGGMIERAESSRSLLRRL
jgi:hypothetical protein